MQFAIWAKGTLQGSASTQLLNFNYHKLLEGVNEGWNVKGAAV